MPHDNTTKYQMPGLLSSNLIIFVRLSSDIIQWPAHEFRRDLSMKDKNVGEMVNGRVLHHFSGLFVLSAKTDNYDCEIRSSVECEICLDQTCRQIEGGAIKLPLASKLIEQAQPRSH